MSLVCQLKGFDNESDLTGPGVVLAFCINAAVTVCLAGYVYLFAEGTYLERWGGTTVDYLSRRLTHRAIAMTRTLISRILTRLAFFRSIGTIGRPSWDYRMRLRKPTLQAICHYLGDTQLLTGTSILLALVLRSRHVSQYQYYVGSHLAVLSLVSHQATCLMIADKLEKMSLSMRIWRFFWTLALSAIVAFSISTRSEVDPSPWLNARLGNVCHLDLDISVAAQKHQPAFEIEYSDDYRDNVEGDDMWEFGQILPLLLLLLPLTSFLDESLKPNPHCRSAEHSGAESHPLQDVIVDEDRPRRGGTRQSAHDEESLGQEYVVLAGTESRRLDSQEPREVVQVHPDGENALEASGDGDDVEAAILRSEWFRWCLINPKPFNRSRHNLTEGIMRDYEVHVKTYYHPLQLY
ncbi:hypothetical protein ACCO45_002725 [Purpureocillium lilacinum]|uniref:Uncharacterized protein n=1 Tax=Purpureocillium lilacinum TaxID=33203 RepID=A0ACC4DZ63_PURLI